MHFLYLLAKAGLLSFNFALSASLIYLVVGYVAMIVCNLIQHSDRVGSIILSGVLSMTILTWFISLLYFLRKIQQEIT